MTNINTGLCAVFVTVLYSTAFGQEYYSGIGTVGTAGIYPGSSLYDRDRIYPGSSLLDSRSAIYRPGYQTGGLYDRGSGLYRPGRLIDRGGLFADPYHHGGSRSVSHSADICRHFGEVALHDHRGYVRTCSYSYQCRRSLRAGYPSYSYANCRRTRGSSYGMCCNRIDPVTPHTPDYHCPGGEENRGFCDPYNGEPCPNVHHQRCHIERPGVNFYRDARGRQWPGICCSLDRPHPAHRVKK